MVDVDVCVGGDSTRRKMDALTDSAVEIVPLELYDSARAKIAANLQWICAKAYGIGKITFIRKSFLVLFLFFLSPLPFQKWQNWA